MKSRTRLGALHLLSTPDVSEISDMNGTFSIEMSAAASGTFTELLQICFQRRLDESSSCQGGQRGFSGYKQGAGAWEGIFEIFFVMSQSNDMTK